MSSITARSPEQPKQFFYCRRHPFCRDKLPSPVESSRNAFCCSKCEASFYRTHCRVCERPFKRKNSRKELCGRDSCENEFRRNKLNYFSVWHPPKTNLGPNPKLTAKPEKSEVNSTTCNRDFGDRGSDLEGVQIAGPKLSSFEESETVAVNPNDPNEVWPVGLGRQVRFEYDRLLATIKIGQHVSGCDLSKLDPNRVRFWRDRAWQAAVRIVMGETITGHADDALAKSKIWAGPPWVSGLATSNIPQDDDEAAA